MKKFFLLVVFVVVLTSMYACTPGDPSPSTAIPLEDANLGYPVPSGAQTEDEPVYEAAYPIIPEEISEAPEILEIPTPSADSGIVFGSLKSLSKAVPISYTKVYLATKIEIGSEDDYIISIQENSSPHTTSTQSGEFVISDIPPGEYLLILVTPIDTYPIMDKSGEQIEVIINAGESLDFGELYSTWLDFGE